jgi:EAL domain-containing protein (putative c-di-GMP-specific phosphodiesterase class I)
MGVDLREQAELLHDLRQALERGEMELYYQPKIDARSLQVTAAEACCAGSTRAAAWSARRCSSRWPSATG